MNRHNIMMIIGCTLPLLLIFILPLFGISGNVSILIFILIMFGCHFMMLGRHGMHSDHNITPISQNDENHASHQH